MQDYVQIIKGVREELGILFNNATGEDADEWLENYDVSNPHPDPTCHKYLVMMQDLDKVLEGESNKTVVKLL